MAEFKPNPNVAGLLGRTPEMAQMLQGLAEKVAATVRQIGPRGEGRLQGHYVDMIEAVVGVEGPTLIGRVNANKFTSGFVEFGTVKMAALAPLRRAVEAAGLRLGGGRG